MYYNKGALLLFPYDKELMKETVEKGIRKANIKYGPVTIAAAAKALKLSTRGHIINRNGTFVAANALVRDGDRITCVPKDRAVS